MLTLQTMAYAYHKPFACSACIWPHALALSCLRLSMQPDHHYSSETHEPGCWGPLLLCHVQGEVGEAFFLLALGTAAATRAGSEQPVATFKAGSYFGEQALHKSEPR